MMTLNTNKFCLNIVIPERRGHVRFMQLIPELTTSQLEVVNTSVVYKYFLLLDRLSFYSFKSIFGRAEVLNFDEAQFIF